MPDERMPPLPAHRASASMKDAIEAFISDPRADMDAMTPEEVDRFLQDEGVDLTWHQAEMKRMFGQIVGEERRQRAAAQRQDFFAGLGEIPNRVLRTATQARQELQVRLNVLQQQNPQAAGAYFRKFANADDEDVEEMLADLDLLEQVGEDEQQSDRSNEEDGQ